MRRRILLIPLALFLLLAAVLFWQLTRNAAGGRSVSARIHAGGQTATRVPARRA